MACIGVGSLSVSPSPSQCLLPFTYYYYYHSSLTLSCSRNSRRIGRRFGSVRAESMATDSEKLGIKIERNPPESKLTQFGVRKWPKWGCPPSKFPWTYDTKEICYLLEGKVKVTPDGSSESVEIGAGDLVEFPKGMSCTWDVSVGVDKHYNMG
ncbi:RmlC-like cupins superfamily protein [Fagus crenata]